MYGVPDTRLAVLVAKGDVGVIGMNIGDLFGVQLQGGKQMKVVYDLIELYQCHDTGLMRLMFAMG